jgi:hypothetical protein
MHFMLPPEERLVGAHLHRYIEDQLYWVLHAPRQTGKTTIEREYAAGRGRMDLAVEYHGVWNIIEVKLLRQGRKFETVMKEGIRQTLGYRDAFSRKLPIREQLPVGSEPQCYLVIFDRRPEKDGWDERLTWENSGGITVVGC